MDLSIVIPTMNRGLILDKTLKTALTAIEGMNAEIIVVNDSKIGAPSLPAGLPQLLLINNPKQGVASARNLGARKASGDLVLFLDDDILISAETIRHLIAIHNQLDHVALNLDWVYPPEVLRRLDGTAFGRFLIFHNLTTFKGWYANAGWQENELFQSLSVASFHLSMRRDDFVLSGGYDDEFLHAGFEDYDFPIRLKKTGLQFYIDTRARVFHNEEDRMDMKAWLDSQERRAVTRATAVQRGYHALMLHYGSGKKTVIFLLLTLYPVIILLLKAIPNIRLIDPFYFRLVSALQAAKIYRGYTSGFKK